MAEDTNFKFSDTPLPGLKLIGRTKREDHRGFLSRFYCDKELRTTGFSDPIVQVNHTLTRTKGAVRGLHFQRPPYAEDKFVSCLRGEIFDVAVDLRNNSPTYLQWHGEILSDENRRSLFIPKGFAHGFQALSDDCELLYLHTARYAPDHEAGLNVCDPKLAIDWPLPISELSQRDRDHPFTNPEFNGITL